MYKKGEKRPKPGVNGEKKKKEKNYKFLSF